MNSRWPDLAGDTLPETLATFRLWAQIIGKVKLASTPWVNESWHVPLYVSARGLTSGLVTHDDLAFSLEFDLLAGRLELLVSDGNRAETPLRAGSVAALHGAVLKMLDAAGIDLTISPRPCEIPGALPFADDTVERMFDANAAIAWWQALIQVQRVFHRFRSRFVGKNSPIHYFWGSGDLAVTRFSGRAAPPVKGGGANLSAAVDQDAYAGEQASCGFWPGGGPVEAPSFYIEAWPVPAGFATAPIGPSGARFVPELGEWVLEYAAVRSSDDPDATLIAFLQSGYDAIADAGGWDRSRLERDEGPIGRPPSPRDVKRPLTGVSPRGH